MLKIYGVPISVHTRKVIVVALHKGLPHEVVPVVPVIPGNPPPNWRALSPTGKIPVLQDGDFTLADSAAICAYLERKAPQRRIYPRSDREHASALSLEQYAGGALFGTVVHPLFHETFVNPNVRKVASDAARIGAVLTQVVPEVFGHLEALAARGAFFAGAEPSVADWAVASNLVTLQYIGYALDAVRHPQLAAHFERTIRTGAMCEALRREQAVVQSMGLANAFLGDVLA